MKTDLLTIGMVNDMYVKNWNDRCLDDYAELPIQANPVLTAAFLAGDLSVLIGNHSIFVSNNFEYLIGTVLKAFIIKYFGTTGYQNHLIK